jgi:hypothetical protein
LFDTVETIGQVLAKNLIELMFMAWKIKSWHMWRMRVQT